MGSYLQNFKFDLVGAEQSPKLVFLHGLMGSGANWRKISTHLRDRFQVLSFDQRGHGRSFHPKGGYAPEDYAEDLLKILDDLGWSAIHLVGHSMGGRNALKFASLYPEKVRSLVIEDIGPEGNPVAMERTLRLLDLVPTPFPDKTRAKEFFENDFPLLIKNHPQKSILGPYLYTNIEEKSDGTADWRFHKDGIIESLRQGHFRPQWEEVRSLKMPTLWIRGERSEDLPRAEFEKVLAANSKIRGHEISGAGHWVHFEKPKEFMGLLESFYSSQGQEL
jgi:pimeloyl-ACP methyl ester carboxylesterase